jgi:hypothetical protein
MTQMRRIHLRIINVNLTKETKKQITFFVALKIEICKEQSERCLLANSVFEQVTCPSELSKHSKDGRSKCSTQSLCSASG